MQLFDFNIGREGDWSHDFGVEIGTWLRNNGPELLEAAQDPANLTLGAAALAGSTLSCALGVALGAKTLHATRDAVGSRPGEVDLGTLKERPLHYLTSPPVRLGWKDRVSGGLQVVGPPGAGKTVLFLDMATKGLLQGHTVVVFEQDGDLVEQLLEYDGPLERDGRVFLFDPADRRTMKWNPLAGDPEQVGQRMVDTLNSISDSHDFYKNLGEDVCRNLTALALAYAGHTGQQPHVKMLLGFLSDHDGLESKLSAQRDEAGRVRVRATFLEDGGDLKVWLEQEFLSWDRKTRLNYLLGFRNLLRKLLSSDKVIEALTPEPGEATLDLGEALSTGGLVILKASSRDFGIEASEFLLSCLLQAFQQETLRRDQRRRRPVEAYIDEAHVILGRKNTTVADSFGRWVVQARKFNVAAHIGHQSFHQLPETLQGTLDTSMRNKILFGGLHDADARHAQALLGHVKRRKIEYREVEGGRSGSGSRQKFTRTVEEPYYSLSEIESLPARRAILRARKGEVQLPPRTVHVGAPISPRQFGKKFRGGDS